MIGNPAYYSEEHRQYTRENLEKLKSMGVDTVLVNIAWSRPYIDAVVLEHVAVSDRYPLLSDPHTVALRSAQLSDRSKAIHAVGMKSLGLFGIPQYFNFAALPEKYRSLIGSTVSDVAEPTDQVACILSPEVLDLYKELLTKVITKCDLDGILVYTCDENADVCNETGNCPRCHGIPIEDRLPDFLNALYHHCRQIKSDFEMWWEPWEFSASQSYLCEEKLDIGIGIACHSTLHEVYHINHPDPWLRNMGMLCQRAGRELLVDMFLSGSGEELGPIRGYPCPRLTFEQIRSLDLVEGVTCVKEYFGTAMAYLSVNEEMASATLSSDKSYGDLISSIAGKYSTDTNVQQQLIDAWEKSSQALLMTPWDLSWVLRFSNLQPYDLTWYGKISFVDSMRTPWTTPSWEANRRSYYMITANAANMSESAWRDMDKRMSFALKLAEQAEATLRSLQWCGSEILMQADAVQCFRLFLISRQNYMRLCLLLQNRNTAENDLRKILTVELENSNDLAKMLQKMDVAYYFDPQKTIAGAQWIEGLLNSSSSIRDSFFNIAGRKDDRTWRFNMSEG